jgi:hypothetical protein
MAITTIYRTTSGVNCETLEQARHQEAAERLIDELPAQLPGGINPRHAERLLRELLDLGLITDNMDGKQ